MDRSYVVVGAKKWLGAIVIVAMNYWKQRKVSFE